MVNDTNQMWRTLLPGGVSATTSVLLGYPIDTVKTRVQTGMYLNVTSCVVGTMKNEGFFAFYRGLPMPFFTLLAKRSIQFSIYEGAKESRNHFVAGAMAGLVSPLSNPMHVIKIHMQDNHEISHKNVVACARFIYSTEGVRGFFKGVVPNFVKDVLFGSLYLGSYGTLKEWTKEKKIINSEKTRNFICGGTAGSIAWAALMPADFIRTACQNGQGLQFVFKEFKAKGPLTLWRGGVPTVARIFPINALAMTAYEYTKSVVQKS